jgi:AsmA protein
MRLRTIAIIAACVIALPLAGAAIFVATLDGNSYKPQIIDAARDATGRALRLSGDVRLKPALVPTLVVDDVGFANIEGGSRAEMARLRQLEVQVALLPLLSRRIEITRLALIEPDILLERLADGRANWEFTPPRPAAPAPPPPGSPPAAPGRAAGERTQIGIDELRIADGRLAISDAQAGLDLSLALTSLEARLPAGGAPMALAAEAVLKGQPVSVKLAAGPFARLMAPPDGTPWPIDLAVAAAGARLAVKGSIARPTEGKGYDVAFEASVPELARLAPFVPDVPLPPVRELTLAARVADRGGPMPAIGALTLAVGESDLAMLKPDLKLRRLRFSAETIDAPTSLALDAALGDLAIGIEGRTGPLAALIPGAAPSAPWPVRLNAALAQASFSVEGTIERPLEPAGVVLRLQARVPELVALSPLAGQPLPALRDIVFAARLSDRTRGGGFDLRDLSASAQGSDVSGEASLILAAQSRIEAKLESRRLDIDALLAALPASPPPAAAGAAPPALAPAPMPARDGRVIPDTPLPFDALGLIDARIAFGIAELIFGATQYRDAGAELALTAGHLVVKDLKATLPSGTLSGSIDIDAGQAPPAIGVALRAPRLELATLLPQLGVPLGMRGPMEIDLSVKGRGGSARAIAATLDGHLGLAIGQGSIDNRLLESAIGELWRLLVPGAPRGGNTTITCGAVRFDVAAGQAQTRVLLVDTPLALVSGSGGINLAQERLALRLVPTVRLGGGGISVPVHVGGSFAAPSYRADAAGALGGVAAGAATGAGQGATVGGPLGAIIGGVVGATRQGAGEAASGDCAGALAIARGQPSTAATGPPAPAQPSQPAPSPRSPIPGLPLPRLPFR